MTAFLERVLVPPLKVILDPLHHFLDGVPEPLWRISVCLFLLFGALWTMFLRRESIFRGAPKESRWCDLRIWVCVLLTPYLFIYLIF